MTFTYSVDSAGCDVYYLSGMYTDEKPFNKWYYMWIHRLPEFSDTTSGIRIGYFKFYLEKFNYKPSEKELNDLLDEWDFTLFEKDTKIIEAGIDNNLWMDTFGFVPDKKKIIKM